MEFRNGIWMHKDKKEGPSRMSQNDAFSLPKSWGGCNCLLKVDMAIVQELKEFYSKQVQGTSVSIEFGLRRD